MQLQRLNYSFYQRVKWNAAVARSLLTAVLTDGSSAKSQEYAASQEGASRTTDESLLVFSYTEGSRKQMCSQDVIHGVSKSPLWLVAIARPSGLWAGEQLSRHNAVSEWKKVFKKNFRVWKCVYSILFTVTQMCTSLHGRRGNTL